MVAQIEHDKSSVGLIFVLFFVSILYIVNAETERMIIHGLIM